MSEIHSEIQRHGTMYLISSMGITIIGFLPQSFMLVGLERTFLGHIFLSFIF